VICTLGNFATKLLRADAAGITRVHGRPEVHTIGSHTTRLYPIYHPAAALYTPRTLETLREDFLGLPGLLGLPPAMPSPALADPVGAEPVMLPAAEPVMLPPAAVPEESAPDQLGLF
jgi:hypothetical protein